MERVVVIVKYLSLLLFVSKTASFPCQEKSQQCIDDVSLTWPHQRAGIEK